MIASTLGMERLQDVWKLILLSEEPYSMDITLLRARMDTKLYWLRSQNETLQPHTATRRMPPLLALRSRPSISRALGRRSCHDAVNRHDYGRNATSSRANACAARDAEADQAPHVITLCAPGRSARGTAIVRVRRYSRHQACVLGARPVSDLIAGQGPAKLHRLRQLCAASSVRKTTTNFLDLEC